MAESHGDSATTRSLQELGTTTAVRSFTAELVERRPLVRYPGKDGTGYVAFHRGTGAPVAVYAHHDYVDVAMARSEAERVSALTGATIRGKKSLPYLHLDAQLLHYTRHRALLLQSAVEGVDWTTSKRGKAPSVSTGSTAVTSANAVATPATCPRCWTVPAANGVCSC